MVVIERYTSNSPEETRKIGADFGSKLKSQDIVLLDGVLGGGKTVFVKGIADALDIDEEVTSPSFSILNIYEGLYNLYHFDLYRIDDEGEIELLLQDYIYDDSGITVIEWGKKALNLLNRYYSVEISIGENGERNITVGVHGI